MKYENELNDLRLAIAAFERIAPNQFALIAFTKEQLANEVEKGVKLAYLRRVHKELLVCARATFSKSQFEAFKLALVDSVFGSGPKGDLLQKIVTRGKIKSEDEFREVMAELDALLQRKEPMGDKDKNMVLKINDILLAFEQSNRTKQSGTAPIE